MRFEDLPQLVRASPHSLALETEAIGGKMFVFGPFARGNARPTSDLDIGFSTPQANNQVRQMLAERIPALPTIRPIELVDFDQLEPEFRAVAEENILPL
jgi:predicted nucleotidyltransferase